MSFLEASSVTFTHRKISNKVFSNLPVNFSLSLFFLFQRLRKRFTVRVPNDFKI